MRIMPYLQGVDGLSEGGSVRRGARRARKASWELAVVLLALAPRHSRSS